MCFFFLLLNIPIQPNCQIVLILHIARSVYLPVLQTCSWLVHRKVQMMQHIDGFSAPDFGSSECVALKEVLQNSFHLCMKSKPPVQEKQGLCGVRTLHWNQPGLYRLAFEAIPPPWSLTVLGIKWSISSNNRSFQAQLSVRLATDPQW